VSKNILDCPLGEDQEMEIKDEPQRDLDLSHLLSQVEVKIKTEVEDFFELNATSGMLPVPLSQIKTEPLEM
jgi:hypothetical protein